MSLRSPAVSSQSSATAAAVTSFSSSTGMPSRAASSSRTGTLCQPGSSGGSSTTPAATSTGPGAAMPTPMMRLASTPLESARPEATFAMRRRVLGTVADGGVGIVRCATTPPARSSSTTVITEGSRCTPRARRPRGSSRRMVRGLPTPDARVPASTIRPSSMSLRTTFVTVWADSPVLSATSTRLTPSGERRTASRITAWLYPPTAGRFVPARMSSSISVPRGIPHRPGA